MPILLAPMNEDLKIIKIIADEKVKKHLESLGITIDSKIRVIDNVKGNLIIIVKNVRLAIDNGIAGKILVA